MAYYPGDGVSVGSYGLLLSPPTSPGGLPGVTAVAASTTSITVTVAGTAGRTYRVSYRLSTDTGWTAWGSTISGSGAQTVTGLEEGARYDFRVEEVIAHEGVTLYGPGQFLDDVRTLSSGSMERLYQEAVISILGADATLAAFAANWSTLHVFDGLREGLGRARNIGRMPYVEVGTVETGGTLHLTGEHDIVMSALTVRGRWRDWTEDSQYAHDFADAIMSAVLAERTLQLTGWVIRPTAELVSVEYNKPVWTVEVRVSAQVAIDPSTRARP